MNRVSIFLIFLFTFISCFNSALSADELIMKNGDRLSGEVLKKEGEFITIKTPYNDELKIKWEEVQELKAAEPIEVLLKGGKQLEIQEINTDEGPDGEADYGEQVEFIKPEPWRKGEGWKFTGNINAAAELERGNNDSDEYDLDMKMEIRDLNDRFTIRGEFENDEENDVKVSDNWMLGGKYDRFLSKRLFTGVVARTERDRFADLSNRTQAGPHLGYQFYDTERMDLKGDVGVVRVREKFEDDTKNYFWGSGWSVDFNYFVILEKLEFYHRNEGLIDVGDADKYLFDAWTGFRWPIVSGIVGSIEQEFEYDSEPADGAKSDDSTYRIKLGYEW